MMNDYRRAKNLSCSQQMMYYSVIVFHGRITGSHHLTMVKDNHALFECSEKSFMIFNKIERTAMKKP